MPHAEATTNIALAPEDAFALVTELGTARAAWDRGAVASRLIRRARAFAPGVHAFTKDARGVRLILRTESWHPPLLHAQRMVKGPWWLRDLGESWRVTPTDDGSRVTYKVTAHPTIPLLPAVFGRALQPWVNARAASRIEDLSAEAHRRAYTNG